MINGGPINSYAINSLPDANQPGETLELFIDQTIIALEYSLELVIEQTIVDEYDLVLFVDQTISTAEYELALFIDQSIVGEYELELFIDQTIYSPASVVASWTTWRSKVTVGGVDVTADCFGQIKIVAERSSARIAEFSVGLSGVVDANSWIGQPITIDYVQAGGAVWRRFTGVISDASIVRHDYSIHCVCTDDLQRIMDAHDRPMIDALIADGHWSRFVFDESANGWSYALDRLKTVNASLDRDSAGFIHVHSYEAKAVADYTFDYSIVFETSTKPRPVDRAGLVNRIDITFQNRFERLWHKAERFQWLLPYTVISFLSQNRMPLPTEETLESAVSSASLTLIDVQYTPAWATNFYFDSNGNAYGWINESPDLVIGADLKTAYRWQQTITHEYQISVTAPDSIKAYGELKDVVEASASNDTTIESWGQSNSDYSSLPTGFAFDANGDRFRDEYDSAEIAEAISAIVAEAAVRIAETHRSGVLTFEMPIAPYLELGDTLRIVDYDIDTKGVVQRIEENFDTDSGQPISRVELAISAGKSNTENLLFGQPAVNPPSIAAASTPFGQVTQLPTYTGGKLISQPENPAWVGYLANLSSPESPTAELYSNEFRMPFDAIDLSKTDSTTETINASVKLTVPHNSLSITAP